MQVKLILGAVIFGLAAGCSNTSGPGHDSKHYFENEDARRIGLQNWHVSCASLGQCPESVGQLVVKSSNDSVGMCTAFLVEDGTKIVTNDHCVDGISTWGCEDSAIVVFPATKKHALKRVKCGRLISRSNLKRMGDPDIAVVQLAEPVRDRKSLELDSSGIADQEHLKSLSVDPTAPPYTNILRVKDCRAAYGVFYSPYFLSPKDMTVGLVGCHVIHGNSGSPAISAMTGKVKAVVNATLEKKGSEPSILDHPDLRGQRFAMATNASCFANDRPVISVSGCSDAESKRRAKEMADADEKEAEEMLIEWSVKNGDVVSWEPDSKYNFASTKETFKMWLKPSCVQPISNWGSKYRDSSSGQYKTKANVKLKQAPAIVAAARFDNSYRLKLQLSMKMQDIDMEFSPLYLNYGMGSFKISRTNEMQEWSEANADRNGRSVKDCGRLMTRADIEKHYSDDAAAPSSRAREEFR